MALTLTRKVGETVVIGDATVVVASVHGQAIKLRIDAPAKVKILRGELQASGEGKINGETKGE